MSLPTQGAGTSLSQIEVDWTALTATADIGGSSASILSYQL